MKRKQRAHSPTTKSKRSYLTVEQIEHHFGVLLLLLNHNFEKLVERAKARRR